MRNLKCDPSTLAGPIDQRVVAKLTGLDPAFVAHMESCHGGIPQIGAFDVGSKRGQIGLFLTLLDDESKLLPPARPHFDHSEDERVINSIWFLVSCDHATSRALFQGLLPFAALEADMCLDRAYVDLLCFDNRKHCNPPPVVLWDANSALHASLAREDLPFSELFDEAGNMRSVPWDDFLVPVAPDYTAFVEMLQPISDSEITNARE
jgi:hypothetical protein